MRYNLYYNLCYNLFYNLYLTGPTVPPVVDTDTLWSVVVLHSSGGH